MSDNLDDLIHGAFVQFDAEESGSHEPAPGTAAVRRTVAHRRRVRYASPGALLAVLIAVPVALIATAPGGGASKPAVGASGSPTATASPSSSPAPSIEPSPSASATGHTHPPTLNNPRNGTLDVPAFPGLADECGPSGPRTFVKGVAQTGQDVAWTIGPMAVRANLDGTPGNELLTTLACDTGGSVHVTELIALKVAGDGTLSVLGYVINPGVPSLRFTDDQVTVAGGVVSVTTSGPAVSDGLPPCFHQTRRYAYRNGTFAQVSGPTSFAALPDDIRQIDLRNAGVWLEVLDPDGGGGASYCVALSGGSGTADVYPDSNATAGAVATTFTLDPVSIVTDTGQGQDVAVGLVHIKRAGKPAVEAVQTLAVASGAIAPSTIVATGTHGITSIQSVTGSGTHFTVDLTVGGKAQTWTYTISADSGSWEHTS